MTSNLIFIFGRMRSGTSVLRDLFCRNGALNADEIFHADLSHKYRFFEYLLKKIEENEKYVHPSTHRKVFCDFMDYLKQENNSGPVIVDIKYFGINMIYTGEGVKKKLPYVIDYAQKNNVNTIHINRKNSLRICVSECIAKQCNVWALTKNNSVPLSERNITVSTDKIIRFLSNAEIEFDIVKKYLSNKNTIIM